MYESTLLKMLSFRYGSKRPAERGLLTTNPAAKAHATSNRIRPRERRMAADYGTGAPAGHRRCGDAAPGRRSRRALVPWGHAGHAFVVRVVDGSRGLCPDLVEFPPPPATRGALPQRDGVLRTRRSAQELAPAAPPAQRR